MTAVLSSTAEMVALTGRRADTIRHVCPRQPGGYDYDQCAPLLDEHPEEIIAVTAAEAEQWMGISANRIYQWVFRKQIAPFDKVGRSPRYRVEELQRLRSREARKAQLDL